MGRRSPVAAARRKPVLVQSITATGTFTPSVSGLYMLDGCGGGGGGSGGARGAVANNTIAAGGGAGGGGSKRFQRYEFLEAGVSYTATIGDGGDGSAGASADGTSAGTASNGTGTTFVGGSVSIAWQPGAAAGGGQWSSGTQLRSFGGPQSTGIDRPSSADPNLAAIQHLWQGEGYGGNGGRTGSATQQDGSQGQGSGWFSSRATAGTAGVDATGCGGSGGGSGGSGGFGVGGAGGNGGAGHATTGVAGSDGAAAAANSGAGGGGGGGGGNASTISGNGGAGGKGGSGRLDIYFIG